MTEMTIRIVLADDHTLVRTGIKALLAREPDLEVAGEASDGHEAVAVATKTRPDVVLLDIKMPGMGGLEACRRIKARLPDTRVLMLTMYEDPGYLREALQAGASGYLLKESRDEQLMAAIRAVHQGEMSMSPEMVKIMASSMVSDEAPETSGDKERYSHLTPREKEVFTLIARGYSNLEIASALFVSVKTVETHKSNLMKKLKMTRRSQLVRYALELGLLGSDTRVGTDEE